MKQMKTIIHSFFVITLTGCTSFPLIQSKPVEVVTIAEPMPMYHPPLPMEVQLVDIDWEILTPELMQEYLNQIDNGSAPETAYYSLTSKDYENLSMNMAEVKRYIRDTLSIIEFYREYDDEKNSDEEE